MLQAAGQESPRRRDERGGRVDDPGGRALPIGHRRRSGQDGGERPSDGGLRAAALSRRARSGRGRVARVAARGAGGLPPRRRRGVRRDLPSDRRAPDRALRRGASRGRTIPRGGPHGPHRREAGAPGVPRAGGSARLRVGARAAREVMRLAVSGSHGTGKSTLIAAFLSKRPEYRHEPEAFETLGDDVELTESGEPTADGLRALLEYAVAAVESRASDACVVFERSPVDYLAYVAASREARRRGTAAEFLSAHAPIVKASLRALELIAYLPVSPDGFELRPGEDAGFRRRVDRCLRRALLEDEYDLLADPEAP